MIGLVLVTHGKLAEEFRHALEHVVGPQKSIETVCIGPEDDMDQRRQDILEAVETDPEFLKNLRDDLLMLVTKAPPELQAAVPYFEEIRSGDLTRLVREVRPGLLSHLAREE